MRSAPFVSRFLRLSNRHKRPLAVLFLTACAVPLILGTVPATGQVEDVTLSITQSTAVAGHNAGFTLTVNAVNNTQSAISDTATVTLGLPNGVTTDQSAGCTASNTPGSVDCPISYNNLSPGNTPVPVATIPAHATASSAGSTQETGSAVSTSQAQTPPPHTTYAVSPYTVTITAQADLTVTNAFADLGTVKVSGQMVAGNHIEYSIVFTNIGPSDAQNVSLTDNWDSVQLTGAKVCEVVNPADCSVDANFTSTTDDPITLASGSTLAAGAVRTFKVRALLPHDAMDGNALDNNATATSPTPDPSTPNGATADTTIATEADLHLTEQVSVPDASPYGVTDAQTATPHRVVAGDTNSYSYTLTVANDGPSDNSGGFDVTDVLPAGASFAGSPDGCTAPDNPQTVVCPDHSDIATTDSARSFTFSVTTDSSVLPTNPYSDAATVTPATGATDDPSSANNDSSAPVNLITRADLTASVSTEQIQTPAIYANGVTTQNSVLFTFIFANNGPSDAQAIDVVNSIQQAGLIGSKYCFLLDAATCNPTTTYTSGAAYPTSDDLSLGDNPVALASGHSAVVVVKALADPSFRGLSDPTRGELSITDQGTISSSTTLYNTDDDSDTSTVVKVDTAALPPVAILATPGDKQIGIEWLPTPDSKNGGTDITGYKVFATFVSAPQTITCVTPTNPVLSTGTTTNATTKLNGVSTPVFSYVVGGFTDGCTYSITVKTVNAVDDSNASNALPVTPSAVAKTTVIPAGGNVSLDTGFAGGAATCSFNADGEVADPNCKAVVSKYSLTDTTNLGSLTNLDTESVTDTTFAGALALFGAATATADPQLCRKVVISPDDPDGTVGQQVQGDCTGDVGVRSTYPNLNPNVLHLEYDQYDTNLTTTAEGAPCLAVQTDGLGNVVYSNPVAGFPREPICTNPSFPINSTGAKTGNWLVDAAHPAYPNTNICAEGQHWTSPTRACAYIYFESAQVDGWDLAGKKPTPTSKQTVPYPCDPSTDTQPYCGLPFVIGSSVQAGIKAFGTQIVRPWCAGKYPSFTFIPCVFKYQWLNKSTGKGNNDVQVQTYMPEIDLLKGGNNG